MYCPQLKFSEKTAEKIFDRPTLASPKNAPTENTTLEY